MYVCKSLRTCRCTVNHMRRRGFYFYYKGIFSEVANDACAVLPYTASGKKSINMLSGLETDSEDELPPSWEERVNLDGKVYYAKLVTLLLS